MQKKSFIQYIAIALMAGSLASCERVIDLDLPDGSGLPYVDAFITDQPGVQTIRFLKATDYLSSNAADPVSDAQVSVEDMTAGKSYTFSYQNGSYIYDAGSSTIGVVGHTYQLNIAWKGEQFNAVDTLKRNTVIDSLTSQYKEEKDGDKAGYYVKLYAHDAIGAIDYYWIRTYRNGALDYNVGEMLSSDGTIGVGDGLTDGYAFITPLRDGVTSGEKPYEKGDNVKVLLRSLSKPSYEFMQQVQESLNNDGLFGKVLHNVPSNISNQQASGTNKIYGWFGTVAEVSQSITVQ